MRNLKICFFIPFFPFVKGGAEYQSKLIAVSLLELGYEVFFISQGLKSGEILYQDGFKIYGVEVQPTIREKLTLYKNFSERFEEIINIENPDIVYQRILNTFSYRISKISMRSKIPFILHVADNYSVEFTGSKGFLKKQLFIAILKTNTAIICQTKYQYSKVENLVDNNLLIIVPNMHPVIMTEVKEKVMSEILWIGNARPVKQLELFLELANIYKDSDYLFKIIGNLPKSNYGNQLKELIDDCSNVKYYGEQENSFINKELSKTALLVNTSVSEGFSNTFIQAWMSGTPVLSLNSDPDGVIEQYNLGVNCMGIKSRLFSELENILNSSNYLDTCKNCLSTSNKLFSLKNNVESIETIFNDILITRNE